MQQNGVAEKRHYDVMVGTLSSAKKWKRLFKTCKTLAWSQTFTYGKFLYQLIVEGYEDEASRIVYDEMAQHDIEPSELCYSYLDYSPYRKARMRLSKLKYYVKAKNFDAAWRLHDVMEKNGVLDPDHIKYMSKIHESIKRKWQCTWRRQGRSGCVVMGGIGCQNNAGKNLHAPVYSWGGTGSPFE